jgi:TolA-binding protein
MLLLQIILLIAALGVNGFAVPSNRAGLFQTLRSSTGDGDETSALMSMIEKRDIVIQDLEKQLDVLDTDLRKHSNLLAQREKQILDLQTEAEVKANMLTKRDQLIENLEEEILELESQLKSVGKFKEKRPPMKGRKVVGDEDDWVDPLQDVQGSLLFHFGMTIRLTIITIFYRIPKFLLNFPKKFLK